MRSRWPNWRAGRLVDLVRAWAEREGANPVLVFDGPAPRERQAGVELYGTYGESADDWIVREAERLFDEGRSLWLVTSDRELRRRCEPYVERTIGGGAFATELEGLAQ
jgi:YacP-like NYN domain